MIYKLPLFFVLSVVCFSPKETTTVSMPNQQTQFDWLLGAWKMPVKNGVLYEYWEFKDKTYQSKSYKVNTAGDTTMLENAQILKKKNELNYVPLTFNQNDGQQVYFKMIEVTKHGFIAGNAQHDFPQKIAYQLKSKDTLYVIIDGHSKGQYRKQEFFFTKTNQ
jgi:hypothetical protein